MEQNEHNFTIEDGTVPRILQLANQIARDISRRNLKPGDPYQGTTETAEMLGVSTTAANRALQVLVKRQVISRRQRKGTFVAVPPSRKPDSPLGRVHLLVQENYLRSEGLLSDGVIVGMHEALPSSHVQFSFLPPNGEAEYVRDLLAEALRSGKGEGFVLVRASLQVQRLVAASPLPAVVHGSLHASVQGLPWIDRDHRAGGRLMVQHLLSHGCSRIVVLMRDRMFRGDHDFCDSVRDSLADHAKPMTLILRSLPPDMAAIRATVLELLQRERGQGRVGLICRSEPLANGAAAAAGALGLQDFRDLNITLSDAYRKESDALPRWPYLRPVLSPEQVGQSIGRMLAQQALGRKFIPAFEIVPVDLDTRVIQRRMSKS